MLIRSTQQLAEEMYEVTERAYGYRPGTGVRYLIAAAGTKIPMSKAIKLGLTSDPAKLRSGSKARVSESPAPKRAARSKDTKEDTKRDSGKDQPG